MRPRDREIRLLGRDKVQDDIRRSQFRYGPLFLYSTFEISDFGYDENLYAPTEEERDDLIISVSAPQKLYLVASKKLVFSADLRPGYTWYKEAEDDRHWNHRYRADVHLLFNRMYSDFYYERIDERKRDLSELNFLVNLEQSEVGNESEIAFSSRTTVLTGVSFRDIKYPDGEIDSPFNLDEVTRLERQESKVWATVRHRTFPVTSTSFGFARENYDFTNSEFDGERNQLFAGAQRETARTTMRSEVGYAVLDYAEPSLEDYHGPLGFVSYDFRPRERYLLALTGRRDLVFSVFENNQHFAADRLRAALVVPFTRFFDFRLTGEIGRNEYFVPTLDPTDGVVKLRQDDITYASAGILVRLARIAFGVDVADYERVSNFSGYSEDGIRLVLRLSLTP